METDKENSGASENTTAWFDKDKNKTENNTARQAGANMGNSAVNSLLSLLS